MKRYGVFLKTGFLVVFLGLSAGCSFVETTTDVAWDVTKVGAKLAWETTKIAGKGIKTTVNVMSGKTVVPLTRRGNSLFVRAGINGRASAQLLLDTGASPTQISSDLARRLGIDLRKGHSVNVRIADGRMIETVQILLKEVRVGGAVAKNVPAVVLPGNNDYDGLLGMSFLNNFIFRIDSQKGELVLQKRVN
ncbi:MAG: retropepsin-like aspartic protease [Candidatus Omnitrophota bacterium]